MLSIEIHIEGLGGELS